jgi:NADPH:quinone reductase-like Zn-dependent oxidoreductase
MESTCGSPWISFHASSHAAGSPVPDPKCPRDGVVIDVEVIRVEGGDSLHRARTCRTAWPLPLWGKNASLIGFSLMTSLTEEHARTYRVIDECIAKVAAGNLRVVIDRTFGLKDAAEAHRHVESRSVFGRVVMLPHG